MKVKMPKDIGTKWLEMLRSGKYDQCEMEMLFIDGDKRSYCALGLLLHLLGVSDKSMMDYKENEEEKIALGPIFKLNPSTSAFGLLRKVSDMNDKEGKSFAEIADYIEQNIELV